MRNILQFGGSYVITQARGHLVRVQECVRKEAKNNSAHSSPGHNNSIDVHFPTRKIFIAFYHWDHEIETRDESKDDTVKYNETSHRGHITTTKNGDSLKQRDHKEHQKWGSFFGNNKPQSHSKPNAQHHNWESYSISFKGDI